ncbi:MULTISPECIES: Uma2 family endonuclease [Pseudoalteromonas]|uniref:Putative restriction endonuclease domain-containing protein n=1 Tax=Pseudoalteromonas amylolytica TaxID=1859457 RepID=A0A1S1MTC4_9GAMM|nr:MULTISPECIES: Uma2 family endonuclease [Pseudoalteromonas]OHU85070.1 hypothetical protein BFC16_20550 [Pseudoalteromonas sp. JW3]OHU89978.1 hypothetical protein BET10_14425 [Pseudoalteromonas amylolytica]
MPIVKNDDGLSPEAYLLGESTSTVKHELIDGQVYAMAGASANHERICQNMARKLGNHLEDSPCEPFGSDMKVRVRDNFYYPDVLVDCNFDESEPYFTTTPVIIVEVISRSTRKMDEKVKLLEYINIPTLEEYVVIEQDIADVTVYRKSDDWRSTHYFLGEDFYLKSIDCTVSVADIYRRVLNEDVRLFLEQQKAGSE